MMTTLTLWKWWRWWWAAVVIKTPEHTFVPPAPSIYLRLKVFRSPSRSGKGLTHQKDYNKVQFIAKSYVCFFHLFFWGGGAKKGEQDGLVCCLAEQTGQSKIFDISLAPQRRCAVYGFFFTTSSSSVLFIPYTNTTIIIIITIILIVFLWYFVICFRVLTQKYG